VSIYQVLLFVVSLIDCTGFHEFYSFYFNLIILSDCSFYRV